jgi:hypothetical protein
VIRISVSLAAFEAIAAAMPLGSVGYEAERTSVGNVFIWLDPRAISQLNYLRGPGEDYSAVILRIAAGEGGRSGSL